MSDLFGNHIVGFPMRRLIYTTHPRIIITGIRKPTVPRNKKISLITTGQVVTVIDNVSNMV